MKNHRIYSITALGRPLDPGWPSNRAVLWLMPVLAVAGAGFAWSRGFDGSEIMFAALRAALLGFGAWAVARELAPDDQIGAFFAMGLALTTLANIPEPGFLLLFLALVLARVLNRSTGVELKKTDAVAVLLMAALASRDLASPLPLAITALAFAWGAFLPKGQRWQFWPSAIALAGAVYAATIYGPGIAAGTRLSTHGIVLPAVFGAGFLFTTLATRSVAAPGDTDHQPLSPRRVRAAMFIVLLLAAANLLQGSPQAAKGVALWSVLGGVALGRLLMVLRRLAR